MNRIIAITSGKGGVGKTSICCHLGRAFARRGEKTIMVELDSGLRGLDLLLDVANIVYDLNDLLQANCQLSEAIVPAGENGLSLLAAPVQFQRIPSAKELEMLCEALLTKYDRVLLDSPAGFWMAPAIVRAADLILQVATTDEVCVRDAAFFAEYLRKLKQDAVIRLLFNRVNKGMIKKARCKDLDKMIDQIGVQLIGVIPETKRLQKAAEERKELLPGTMEQMIFSALAGRIMGEDIPLFVSLT